MRVRRRDRACGGQWKQITTTTGYVNYNTSSVEHDLVAFILHVAFVYKSVASEAPRTT
jgi:hypothetical protein